MFKCLFDAVFVSPHRSLVVCACVLHSPYLLLLPAIALHSLLLSTRGLPERGRSFKSSTELTMSCHHLSTWDLFTFNAVLTESLESPLRLLSKISRRIGSGSRPLGIATAASDLDQIQIRSTRQNGTDESDCRLVTADRLYIEYLRKCDRSRPHGAPQNRAENPPHIQSGQIFEF